MSIPRANPRERVGPQVDCTWYDWPASLADPHTRLAPGSLTDPLTPSAHTLIWNMLLLQR